MPLRIVRTAQSCGGHPDDLVEVPIFHLIIMGVALDVHVSQARWQQLKNMSADALMLLSVFFLKDWITTS